MKFFLAVLFLLAVAVPGFSQTPAAKNTVCPCGVNCQCPVCDCAKPSTKTAQGNAQLTYLLSSATSDADAAAALALALSEVREIPRTESNYVSQRLLAVAARQHIVVGVNCEPPEGNWVAARSMDNDGTFDSGKYITVGYFDSKRGEVMTVPGINKLPSTAGEKEIADAITRLVKSQEPQPQQTIQYSGGFQGFGGFQGVGGCVGGQCAGGSCGGGFRMGGGCGPGGCR